jgi:hypothetical protein
MSRRGERTRPRLLACCSVDRDSGVGVLVAAAADDLSTDEEIPVAAVDRPLAAHAELHLLCSDEARLVAVRIRGGGREVAVSPVRVVVVSGWKVASFARHPATVEQQCACRLDCCSALSVPSTADGQVGRFQVAGVAVKSQQAQPGRQPARLQEVQAAVRALQRLGHTLSAVHRGSPRKRRAGRSGEGTAGSRTDGNGPAEEGSHRPESEGVEG